MKNKLTWLAATSALCLLAACGGGGSDAGTSGTPVGLGGAGATAEGAYAGTLTGGASSDFETIIRGDGSFWSLYGTTVGDVLYVAGFTQGTATSSNGSVTSSDLLDFGLYPAVPITLTGTYTSTTISGATVEAGVAGTFSGTVAGVAPYVYATPASVSDVVGSWTLSLLDGETASLSVASTGAYTGLSSGGCAFSGTLTPDANGKNVFNLVLTDAAAPCFLPGQTSTGIAIYTPLTTGGHELIVAAVDSARTVGTAGFGQR